MPEIRELVETKEFAIKSLSCPTRSGMIEKRAGRKKHAAAKAINTITYIGTIDATAGTYYILVYGYQCDTNTYSMTITTTAAPTPTPTPTATTGGGGSSGGKVCFIATSAYGVRGNEVEALGRFRDEYLLTNTPGRAFVSCYERISPPIARYIENKEPLKAIIRFYLKPVVWVAKKVTSNPSVPETLIN